MRVQKESLEGKLIHDGKEDPWRSICFGDTWVAATVLVTRLVLATTVLVTRRSRLWFWLHVGRGYACGRLAEVFVLSFFRGIILAVVNDRRVVQIISKPSENTGFQAIDW